MTEAVTNTTIKMVFLNKSPTSPEQGVAVGWTVVGSSVVVLVSFVASKKRLNNTIFTHVRR